MQKYTKGFFEYTDIITPTELNLCTLLNFSNINALFRVDFLNEIGFYPQ